MRLVCFKMVELSNVKKNIFLLNDSHFIQEVLEAFRIFFKTIYTIVTVRSRLPFDIKEAFMNRRVKK